MGWTSTPLHPALGEEVVGLDLRRELGADDLAELRRLFDSRGLLLFRDQAPSEDDHVRICRHLRPVSDPVGWISNVEAGFHPECELLYHSDFAFTPNPMLGLSLYAIEIAAGAAPTRFISAAGAAERLPTELRHRFEAARVVTCADTVAGTSDRRSRLVGLSDAPEWRYPRQVRPAIFPHPITGAPLLFVLEQQASHVEGCPDDESDELIALAFSYLHAPEHTYTHHWRAGDFVVWDNLTLQHGRPPNPATVRRSLRRVTMGEMPTHRLIEGTGFDPAVRAAMAAAAAER